MQAVRIANERLVGRRFIGGIVDLTGRLVPNDVSDIIRQREAGPDEVFGALFFAGFDANTLVTALSGNVPTPGPPVLIERSSSGAVLPDVSVLSDGFVVAAVKSLVANVEAPPDELV